MASLVSSNTSLILNYAIQNRSRCWKRVASRPSSAAKCCPMHPMPGTTRRASRLVTKSASLATSTSRNRYGHSERFEPISWPWRRRLKDCCPKSLVEESKNVDAKVFGHSPSHRNTTHLGQIWRDRYPRNPATVRVGTDEGPQLARLALSGIPGRLPYSLAQSNR